MFNIETTAIALGLLGNFAPLGVSIACATAWWKSVRRPWIFFMISILAMSALYGFIARIFHLLLPIGILVSPSIFNLEPSTLDPYPMLRIELGLAMMSSVLTAFLGYLLLRASKSAQLNI